MSLNYTSLVASGRAKAIGQPWSPEELDSLLLLERERGIGRLAAADYVRNGILTLEDYDKAVEASFVPKTREEAEVEVEAAMKAHGESVVKAKKKSKKSDE